MDPFKFDITKPLTEEEINNYKNTLLKKIFKANEPFKNNRIIIYSVATVILILLVWNLSFSSLFAIYIGVSFGAFYGLAIIKEENKTKRRNLFLVFSFFIIGLIFLAIIAVNTNLLPVAFKHGYFLILTTIGISAVIGAVVGAYITMKLKKISEIDKRIAKLEKIDRIKFIKLAEILQEDNIKAYITEVNQQDRDITLLEYEYLVEWYNSQKKQKKLEEAHAIVKKL